MDKPLVSVVIPTYNRAEYLREAIASVLAQTYGYFELLVLDNCSPDHTQEVVTSFSDKRIKYLRHYCNIGAIANWTYGVFLANGKYVSILGDDDKYKPMFLERRIKAFNDVENLVAAYGPFEYWNTDEVSNKISASIETTNVSSGFQVLSGIECFRSSLWFQFIGSTLYLTSALQNKWENALRGGKCCDELISALLALDNACRMAWIPEADYIYRIHEQQDYTGNWDIVAQNGETMYKVLYEETVDRNYKNVVSEKLTQFLNFHGKVAWDKGNVELAKHYFTKELKVIPYNISTWMRLIRCLIKFGVNPFR